MRLWPIATALCAAAFASSLLAQNDERLARTTRVDEGLAQEQARKGPGDPHGSPNSCRECHPTDPGTVKPTLAEISSTCSRCHTSVSRGLEDHLDAHLPPVKIKRQMIGYFSRHEDFTCITCHEPVCQAGDRHELRVRNPHLQLDERGDVVERTCLYCHEETPDYRNPGREPARMRYRTPYLCSLCHMMESEKVGMGIGERVPPEMMARKREFEDTYGIRLQLGPGNVVTCTSCHNPHQEGVVIGDNPFAGPQSPARLMVDSPWTLCQACHGSVGSPAQSR